MRLAIMQPYFFPYLGYFQLISAVDKFVFYDDVAYLKNGWVNRNRILLDGKVHWFTLPVKGAPLGTAIREVEVDTAQANALRKLRARLVHGYRNAPFVKVGLAVYDRVMEGATQGIGDLSRRSVVEWLDLLGIKTAIVPSSTMYGNRHLAGVERVMDICIREQADTYCNAPGGRAIYDAATLGKRGLGLRFLSPRLAPYAQPGVGQFVPGLSILDVVMNAGLDAAGEMARSGELLP